MRFPFLVSCIYHGSLVKNLNMHHKPKFSHRALAIATVVLSASLLLLCAIGAVQKFNLLSIEVLTGLIIALIMLVLVFLQDFIKKAVVNSWIAFQVSKSDTPEAPKWLIWYSNLYANTVASCILVVPGSMVKAFSEGGYTQPSANLMNLMGTAIGALTVLQFIIVACWHMQSAAKKKLLNEK